MYLWSPWSVKRPLSGTCQLAAELGMRGGKVPLVGHFVLMIVAPDYFGRDYYCYYYECDFCGDFFHFMIFLIVLMITILWSWLLWITIFIVTMGIGLKFLLNQIINVVIMIFLIMIIILWSCYGNNLMIMIIVITIFNS